MFAHTLMTTAAQVQIKCEDFLKDNRRVYARKARRKKIAIISVEATNRNTKEVRLVLGSSELIAGGTVYNAEGPAVVLRKLSEFTWDFLLYTIIDFHPITAAFEACVFLTGPLYNRRLRRQLKLLSDGEIVLKPGECKKALIAFRGVSEKPDELRFSYCGAGDELRQVQCGVA